MKDNFYITTTLPYVNAEPHIGHALEFIQTDAIARYFRTKLGVDKVLFNIGTDEHGLKIYKKAHEEGYENVRDYVEATVKRFKEFCELFQVNYDNFYQTSHDYHVEPVKKLWNTCLENGDIYKGKYEGYYCVGCEYYKSEKDLVDGKCPDHGKEPIWLSEENYFFKLSKYGDKLLEYFDQNPEFIQPAFKVEEARNFIKKGLTDISISRKKDLLPWGIEVPGDPEHVIYVWFDALTNYIVAAGYGSDEEKFKKWWPVVQTCGPDNMRFQAIIWQAMLASAGIEFSSKILVHGYVLGPDGRKMSKTIGNVVSPFEQVKKFESDTVRYYLLAGMPTFADSSYKEEDLVNLHNSCLADNFGNLINRVIVLLKNKSLTPDYEKIGEEFKKEIEGQLENIRKEFENYDLYTACRLLNELFNYGNKYINDQKPWDKTSTNYEEVLNNLYYLLVEGAKLYEPIIPTASAKAQDALSKLESVILFQKIA